MTDYRWVRRAVVFGLAGALVGVVPDGVSAVAARAGCRATAFVTNELSGMVSTIDVRTRTKDPTDVTDPSGPFQVAITPNGRTVFVANTGDGTVSTIDVKSRTKNPRDIPVGSQPAGVAVTPDGKTAFVANATSDSVLNRPGFDGDPVVV